MTHNAQQEARNTRIENAARTLAERYRSGSQGDSLPEDQRPADIDEALAIQHRVTALLEMTTSGWKCSLPSPEKTVVAPLYTQRIVFSRDTLACTAPVTAGQAEIEPEIAYVIGNDLPPRSTPYSKEEVLAAIASTHIVFELIGARYRDRAGEGFPSMLADRLANDGLFVGPAIDVRPDDASLAAIALMLEGDGVAQGQWQGKHPDGHPLAPLHWLANYLAQQGKGLKRGEVVTTGSYHGVIKVPAGQALRMTFGPLGKLAMTIRPAA